MQPSVVTPASDVDLLEVRIRNFIDERLTAVVGKSYWKSTMPGDVVTQVKGRLGDHLSKHPYLDQTEFTSGRSRLEFCDVSDYEKIFLRNWGVFGNYFKRKPGLVTHMTAFRDLRNCIQHNRIPTDVVKKNGDAAIIWLKGILDKADQLVNVMDENGEIEIYQQEDE